MRKRNREQRQSMRGFSLIELMVSLTIFSILMVVSVGTLLTLIDANAKAQALSSATTNLSFALDSITREIRTGHYYNCQPASGINTLPEGNDGAYLDPKDCVDGSDSITFLRDRDGFKIGYRLIGGAIEQKVLDESGATVTNWEKLTSSDVEIETFDIRVKDSKFYGTDGTGPGAQDQPVVILHIKGKVKSNNGLEGETDFNIQTLIVQRRLDQV